MNERIELISFYTDLINKLKSVTTIVELRPKLINNENDYFKDDFDFIINEKDLFSILDCIYTLSKNNGINFQLLQSKPNKKLFKFFISDDEKSAIIIELWTKVELVHKGGLRYINSGEILELFDKIDKSILLTAIYITHLYYKNKNIFTEENKFRFNKYLDDLEHFPASESAFMLQSTLRALKSKKIELKKANEIAVDFLLDYKLLNKNYWFPKGKIIRKCIKLIKIIKHKIFILDKITPIIGPDGVGKGVITEKGMPKSGRWTSLRFKALFRLPYIYDLRLRIIPQQEKLEKNILDEKILYYIFFTSFMVIRILPFLKRKKRILLDRYFIDYYARPIRNADVNNKPKKIQFYKLIFKLTPIPSSVIFLGCKTHSLKIRKDELPELSVNYLQNLYYEFILLKSVPEILFVSTENSIETSSLILNKTLEKLK